jgi:3-hydroxy-9,10-secoandrosta-1,3,5(10)-triene-9,17-dione monooxygenase
MSTASSEAHVAEGPVFALKTAPAVLDSCDAALQRARELQPIIRARVAETEELRRLPDASAIDLLQSGLCGLLTPKRFGGSELGLEAVLDVTGVLAEACPSTGWVHALWAAHMWLMALFPAEVQEEVWSNPNSLISSVVSTKGTPVKVDGGYRWSGSGAYSSGIDHCNWVSPALNVPDADGNPVRKWLLIPRSDFKIVDDWYTVGLKGTGSKTIVVDDVFIPENRAVASQDMQAGTSAGAVFHDNPQYSATSVCIFTPPLAGTAIGAARGFLQAFEQRLRTRLASADSQATAEQAATLIRYANSCADVDAARAVLMENARRFSRTPSSQVDELDRARCRRDQAYAATTARQAVNSLFESAGASALFTTSDLQRLWRDTNAAAAHHGLMWDVHGMSWGRLAFGLPSNPGGI